MTSDVIDGQLQAPKDLTQRHAVLPDRKDCRMADFTALADGYVAMWNATEPDTRRELIAQVCAPDVRYTDPLADVAGHDQLDAAIAAVQQQFPGFAFSRLGDVDGHHEQARFGWELGPVGTPAPVAGFDVVTTDELGRITRVLGFLDRVPNG